MNKRFGKPHDIELERFNHKDKPYLLARHELNGEYDVFGWWGDTGHFGGPFWEAKDVYVNGEEAFILASKPDDYEWYLFDYGGNKTDLFGAPFKDTFLVQTLEGIPFLNASKEWSDMRAYTADGTSYPNEASLTILHPLKGHFDGDAFDRAIGVCDAMFGMTDIMTRDAGDLWTAVARTVRKVEPGRLEEFFDSLGKELENNPHKYLDVLRCYA